MRQILVFLSRFLSAKSTQQMLLDIARRLAQKTDFTWDDEIVEAFSQIWKKHYWEKYGNDNH